MEAIGPMGGGLFRQRATSFDSAPVSADASNQERQDALQLLSLTPTPVDELIRQSGLSPAVVQTVLLELELAARLERHAGGKVSLISCSPLVLLPPIRISTPLLTAGAVHRQPRSCTRKDRKNWTHAVIPSRQPDTRGVGNKS